MHGERMENMMHEQQKYKATKNDILFHKIEPPPPQEKKTKNTKTKQKQATTPAHAHTHQIKFKMNPNMGTLKASSITLNRNT